MSLNEPSPIDLKQAIREEALRTRDGLNLEQRDSATTVMTSRVLTYLMTLEPFTSVAGYSPIRSEINPLSLMNSLIIQGKTLALPVIFGRDLLFRQWLTYTPLITRQWGLREPDHDAPLLLPDVLLVPLVAFDAQNHRLGYGKGYYDRALKVLREQKHIIAIGVGYEVQRVHDIPVEDHDEPLDVIITDQALYALNKG